VQVDILEAPQQAIEQVALGQAVDLLVDVEPLEGRARLGTEAVDIVAQVGRDALGVRQQGVEGEAAGVIELLPGGALQDGVELLDPVLEAVVLGQHGVFGGREHGVEAAQQHKGQGHAPELGRLIVAAQGLRDRPDQPNLALKPAHDLPSSPAPG